MKLEELYWPCNMWYFITSVATPVLFVTALKSCGGIFAKAAFVGTNTVHGPRINEPEVTNYESYPS